MLITVGTQRKTSVLLDTHLPFCLFPSQSCTKCANASTDKKQRHEDGVDSVGGFRQLLQAAALVTDLYALRSDVNKENGCDDTSIVVAEEQCCKPCSSLTASPDDRHTQKAHFGDILSGTACRNGSSNAAQAQ